MPNFTYQITQVRYRRFKVEYYQNNRLIETEMVDALNMHYAEKFAKRRVRKMKKGNN